MPDQTKTQVVSVIDMTTNKVDIVQSAPIPAEIKKVYVQELKQVTG